MTQLEKAREEIRRNQTFTRGSIPLSIDTNWYSFQFGILPPNSLNTALSTDDLCVGTVVALKQP